jgi:hypothetical protein
MIKDRIPDCVKPSIGDGDVRSNQTEPWHATSGNIYSPVDPGSACVKARRAAPATRLEVANGELACG